jgi:hypothetical protein
MHMLEVKSRKNSLPSLVGKSSSSISLRDFWGVSVDLVGRGCDRFGAALPFSDVLCARDMNRC